MGKKTNKSVIPTKEESLFQQTTPKYLCQLKWFLTTFANLSHIPLLFHNNSSCLGPLICPHSKTYTHESYLPTQVIAEIEKQIYAPFYNNSSCNPLDTKNSLIQQFLSDVYRDLSDQQHYRVQLETLSETDKLSLKELVSNPNTIINPADKEGKIVTLDLDDYINEAIRPLSNYT